MDSPVITMFESLGIHEVMNGDSFFYKEECRIICAELPSLCGDIVGAITSADWSLDDYERYDILVGHDPGGTSLRNINHFK